jgi:hypothetical protein
MVTVMVVDADICFRFFSVGVARSTAESAYDRRERSTPHRLRVRRAAVRGMRRGDAPADEASAGFRRHWWIRRKAIALRLSRR